MGTVKMSAEEKKWRAESDAETMARYQEIISSPERRRRAEEAARFKAKSLLERANAMKFAAGGKLSTRRTTGRKR